MLNFIKKYKLILILLIFTLFLLINTKVNASTEVEFTYNNTSYTAVLPKDFLYYTISYCSDGCFWLNAINDATTVKAVYGLQSVAGSTYHYVRFQNSSNNNLSGECRYYSSDCKTWTLKDSGWDGLVRNTLKSFCYSNIDVYNTSNSIIHPSDYIPGPSYSIELSTAEETLDPIYAYSNYFDISTLNRYEVFISSDNIDYKKMNIETMNHLDGTCEYRYNYKIFSNGTYYFKFVDNETKEENIITYEITNILSNSTNFGFTIDGIPQPFVTYSRIVDQFILQTQSFTYEDFKKLECYYTTNPNLNYSSWDKMSLGTLNNTITGTVEYYFFFSVPQYSEDTTYYFVFYDTTLQKYGYKSSLNCIFDKMNEYEDNVSGVVDEKNSKFNELIQFFNNRLGFLTYPFEFIINLLNKILTINYEEPVLRFPQITNPLDDTVIFEGFDFNFNSILEYEGISYFYNIYLIAVDFILVVAFIKGCKHTIEGVFGNG